MSKEDRIQIALGLKFHCVSCHNTLLKALYVGTLFGDPVCGKCAPCYEGACYGYYGRPHV